MTTKSITFFLITLMLVSFGCGNNVDKKWQNAISTNNAVEVFRLMENERDDNLYKYCRISIKKKSFDVAGIIVHYLFTERKNSPEKVMKFLFNFLELESVEISEVLHALLREKNFIDSLKSSKFAFESMNSLNYSLALFLIKMDSSDRVEILEDLLIRRNDRVLVSLAKLVSKEIDEESYKRSLNELLVYIITDVDLEKLSDFALSVIASLKDATTSSDIFQSEKMIEQYKKAHEILTNRFLIKQK